MSSDRVFNNYEFVHISEDEPVRSIVTESDTTTIVMWYVKPGQNIPPHIHPSGQDTWIILSGHGEYILDAEGTTTPISTGQIVVAHTGQVHGVVNKGIVPLQFVSVVTPQNAGFQPLSELGE